MTRASAPTALVLGAGVSGLTTALVLARRGWRVTVAADRFGPHTVSTVAGALWEYPPSVCGRHHDETQLERSAGWAMTSYHRFAQLAADPGSGVSLRPAIFAFRRPIEEDPAELAKMRRVAAHVPGFMHNAALIAAHGINPDAGVVDAYSYLAPTIDTDRYLAWLRGAAENARATITNRHLTGRLSEQQARLRTEYRADVIVNCTGLGARELTADTTLDPHRGALLRVVNDGHAVRRITAAYAVANDRGTTEQDMIFIVPRGRDRLLLGGIVEPGRWDTTVTPEDPMVRDMLARCIEFLPALRHAHLDPADPLRVGLRPFRAHSVRVQAEPGSRIVHNYGHGGAGVTLSWGCAHETTDLADRLIGRQAAA